MSLIEGSRGGLAVATVGSTRWELSRGGVLTFGRGEGNTVRFGHDPVDRGVPRYAGRLEFRGSTILVENRSARLGLELDLRGVRGFVPPASTAHVPVGALFRVTVSGRTGSTFAIVVEFPHPGTPAPAGFPFTATPSTHHDPPTEQDER